MSKRKDWKDPKDYLIEAYTNKLINDYKQDDEKEQERQRQRALSSPSTSNTTNSPTSPKNSPQTAQTVSQSTPAERDLFKITGRRHTVTDRRRGRDKNEKTQRTADISGQNRGLSRDDNDRFTNTIKGAGKQWLGGQLSGIGTTAQADIVNINSIRGARAERENDYRLTSREEAEKREAESVNKSRTKDGVNLRDMERRYSLDPVGNVSDNYRKIVKGTQNIINKGDSLIESGTQDIEKAKEGANDFEKFLIDNGAQFTQWAGDASLRMIPIVGQALSMGGFFNRAGGMSAYQGRQEGMNPDQQFKYYAGSGLMEVLSELTFQSVGALRATYGKGMFSIADKLTTKASTSGIVNRLLNNTELGKSLFINMARLGGNAVEEGLEEVETDLVDPLLKYYIKKSEDPRAEFEGWDLKQMGYDFLMGATMGGVLGVAEVPNRVKYELNIANSDAFNDGMATSLIKQASVQGRQSDGGRLIPTNAEILAQQLQQQMDNNIPVQPAQIRMLQEAIGQSISENQKQLTRRMTEEYDKAQKSGDLVQMEGTRLESQGIDNASVKLYDDATEKARQVLGEDATQEEVEAVAGVTTGLASTNEIDTVLVKPELKKAVETIVNEGADAESAVSIPVNNAEARDVLENLTAVKRIANRNTILKDVQAKNAEIIKSSVDNMSEGGKNLFASRAEFAQDTIGGNRDRNLEIYRDRFSRLYTDGNTKGADFETSYKRIIGSLDSEALKSVFTEDFARQIFEEGRNAIVTDTAKETAKSRAEEYANRKGGLTFENNNENLISSRERDELQKFAERVGVEINVVKSLSKDASGKALMSRTGKKLVVNGKYQDGVITIASDAQNKLITVAKHELTHHLKETSPEMYQKLEDFVFERWYHGNAEEMEDEIARYTKLYSGQGLDRDGIREEIIADASEAFFTDEGAIQDAISFSEKLGRAIHDGIKTMLDAFLGLQDADSRRMRGYGGFLKDLGILQEAERMWLEALEDTQQRKRNARGGATAEDYVDASTQYTTSDEKHSLVESDDEIERLNSEPTQKSYRAMALIDGKLYPPMATRVKDGNGKWVLQQGADIGQWIKSDITTDHRMFNSKGQFLLKKDNGGSPLEVAYNPYIHSSDVMLNDQFASAHKRPNIVVVEGEIPRSELENGKRAEHDLDDGRHIKAKDPTGTVQWKAGVVQSHLTGTRTVFLTNHFKPTRVVPDSEVARSIQKMVAGTDVVIPYNVVTPSLRQELQKLGVKMEQSKQKGYQVDLNAKYSVTAEDQAYMDAVNRGDMETAQRMVDEEARRKGYNSPLLFHGTRSFGFTRFDLSHGYDWTPTFATNNKQTAETYSGETNRGKINERSRINIDNLQGEQLLSEAKKHLKRYSDFKVMTESQKANEAEDARNGIKSEIKAFRDFIEDNKYAFDDEKMSITARMIDALNAITEASENDDIWDSWEKYQDAVWDFKWADESLFDEFLKSVNEHSLAVYKNRIDDFTYDGTLFYNDRLGLEYVFDNQVALELDAELHKGIYSLYGNIDNMLVIDAEGSNWNQIIPPDELNLYGVQKTRDIAEEAKSLGYSGVLFKNLKDNGGETAYNGVSDVYVFFNANALKSADPVTYDDNGNVIPLSERFNDRNEDIRYSVSEDSEGNEPKRRITEYSTGAYSGQVDMMMESYDGDDLVGYMQYSVYDNTPNIQYIHTNKKYRGQGVAREMLQRLQSHYPDTEINWGMTTPDGTKLKENVTYEVKDKKVARKKKRLQSMKNEISENEKEMNDLWEKAENRDFTEEERSQMQSLGKRWDKLNRGIHDLEIELENAQEVKYMVKLDDDAKYSIKEPESEETETDKAINESMTMEQCRQMIQRCYNIGEIREWSDGEYKNGDEWIRAMGSEEVGMVAENDWSIQQKYLDKIDGILNEDFTVYDVLDAYLAGTLRGKEKSKPTRLDTSKGTGYKDSRFYSPQLVEDAVKALEVADQKITAKNKAEVNKARAKVLLFAHNAGAEETLGLTRAELNKKLRSWSNYSSRARDISKRINANVAPENRWTGIENLSWLSRATVSNDELANLVKDIKGESSEYERSYIARTMLALDTHIDWTELSFEFRDIAIPDQRSVKGFYRDKERKIVVEHNRPNSLAHEMGHALDNKWGREISGTFGKGYALTSFTKASLNQIPNADVKKFANNFYLFMDEISDFCDIRSDYTGRNNEVFARFVDQFVRWTEKISTGRSAYSSFDYNDRFNQNHFIEFARLLQEKASLDARGLLNSTEDTSKFSVSDDEVLDRYIVDRQKRIDDGEQMSFFGSLNETLPSKPKEKTRSEKFYDNVLKTIANIKKKGSWSGFEVKGLFLQYPEFNFIERLNNKADETAVSDFNAFLSSFDKIDDLRNYNWYFSAYEYSSQWKKANRSGKMKFNKLIENRIEEIMAGKAHGRNVGIEKRDYTPTEMRKLFNELNTDKELKELGKKVFDCIDKNFDVKFQGVANIEGFKHGQGGTLGQAGGRTVHLNMKYLNSEGYTDQQKASTILHESIHTVTVYALRNRNNYTMPKNIQDACDVIEDVFWQIKNDPSFKGEYGVSKGAEEMVAELANPIFREKLKRKNVFARVIEAIRNILGIEVEVGDRPNAFKEVNKALETLMSNADVVSFERYANRVSRDYNGKFSVSEEDENAPTPKQDQSTIAKLEEKVADLKSEFKRTDLKTADPKQTRIQAGRLLKRHDSNLSIQNDVVDAFSKIHRLYKEKGLDAFDEASQIALETAKQVVDGIAIIHDEGMEQQKEIREFLKDNEIIISPYIEKNMDDFASFRKKNAFRLKLKKGEVSNLDKYIYPRLQELFPTAFPDEYYKANNKEGGENTDVLVDMLRHIGDVLDNPMYTVETITESTPEWKEYVSDIASDIMETAYGLQTKKTFADKKYEEKVRAVAKAREEALASRDRALAKQAERYETKISYLKQRNRDFKEETRENAEKKRRIAQIAGIHKRLLEKLDTPKDTKHLPDGYAPLVSNVLSMFDFTTKGMEKWAERYGEPSKRYRYLDELRKRLADMSKEDSPIAESGFEIDPDIIEIIEELKADVADTDRLSDLDSATLEDIYTLFKAFEHQLNTFNKAFDENNRQTVIENRDNFINETRDKKTRKDKQGTIGWLQRQLETNNTTPEDFFHLIGGTPEKLYKSIRKGFDKHILNVKSAMDFIKATTEGKDVKKWSENVRSYTTSLGDSIKLTDAQLMSIYCLSKREQAQQHMYSENGGSGIVVVPQKVGKGLKAETLDRSNVVVNSSDIQKWISQLSKEQIEVADRLQRYLSEDMSKLGNETSLKLYGYKKFTEKNYFPIQSSNDWLNSNFDFKGDSPVLKNTGMTKALNKHASNPIVIDDIFTVATKHISTMSLYNSLVPSLTDFQRFWNSKDKDHNTTVQKEFIRVYGEPAYKYVENFMGDLNGAYKRGFEVEGVDKLMSKYKQASIGLNLRVLFQQPTAVARAGAVMNPIYITKALGASATTLKDNLKDMREHCPIALWKSWGFYNTDLARDMRSIMMDEKTISDNFSKAYGIADDLTWSVIFKAVRYEVEAQNKNLEVGSDKYWEKVNERASEVFDRTQVVDSPFHRSQNMRAKDNLSKMVTAFMAEPTKTYNMLKTELTLAKREIQSGQKAQGVKRASRVVQVFVTNALLVSASSAVIDALRGVGGSGDDDKDKNWFERFLAHWWTNTKDNINPLGLLPVFKDVQSVVQGYDVTRMDMQAIGRMVKSLQYMGEYIKEPENSKYTFKNEAHYLLQQSAYLVGLPLANLERDTRGIAFSLAEAVGYDDLFFEEAKFKYQVNDKTKSMWADMYLDAKYKGNTALAKKIKDYITSNDAVTEEYIEEREKKYKKDNKSASQQHAYDSSIQTLETSPIWNTSSEDNKEYYTAILENLSVGIENQSTEYVTKLAKNGLTNEQVILYKLALKKVDKPNKNGKLGGTPTNAEKEDAIRLLERYYNLTQAQKDTLMGK